MENTVTQTVSQNITYESVGTNPEVANGVGVATMAASPIGKDSTGAGDIAKAVGAVAGGAAAGFGAAVVMDKKKQENEDVEDLLERARKKLDSMEDV